MGTREGCVPRLHPCRAGGEDAGTHGPARALLGHCISSWLLRPSVPHRDQDGDQLLLRPCGSNPGAQGSFRSVSPGSGAHTPA